MVEPFPTRSFLGPAPAQHRHVSVHHLVQKIADAIKNDGTIERYMKVSRYKQPTA